MKLNDKRYFVVFDTNILHQTYQNQADFTSFSLNLAFENVIEMINQLDIYDNVEIAISAVVWNELKKQIVEAHDKRIVEFERWKFPEYVIKRLPLNDYSRYVDDQINEYKRIISTGINKIIELPIPKEKCFKRIVTRAFEKEAPFEGKEKNSDKGFKDVLLWESILELVEVNPHANIIFIHQIRDLKRNLLQNLIVYIQRRLLTYVQKRKK